MSAEPKDNDSYESPFSSHDCVDFVMEGPGDTTVRPLTGERLKRAMAERERIAHWEALGYGNKPSKGDATKPDGASPASESK